MSALRTTPAEARRMLRTAATDRAAARVAFSGLPLDRQVALVCETPVPQRADLIALSETPEALVPALPAAELCYIARSLGVEDAGWILEHATESQLASCIDLDVWRDGTPDRARFGKWLAALAEADDEALLRFARAADFELLVLHLASRVAVELKPSDEDWSPPEGSRTLDGQFHLTPLQPGDDMADLLTMLDLLFRRDYWVYFRLLQGILWELPSETEEWAQRWRSGRLQDLGFPPWDEAMQIYTYLRPDLRVRVPERERALPAGEWPLPVWMPGLPADASSEHSLFRALAELPESERRRYLFAFLALANKVAVADRLPLGDADSIPTAIEKAARVASLGLDTIARASQRRPSELLRRVSLEHLFRVGFNEDDTLKPPPLSEPD